MSINPKLVLTSYALITIVEELEESLISEIEILKKYKVNLEWVGIAKRDITRGFQALRKSIDPKEIYGGAVND